MIKKWKLPVQRIKLDHPPIIPVRRQSGWFHLKMLFMDKWFIESKKGAVMMTALFLWGLFDPWEIVVNTAPQRACLVQHIVPVGDLLGWR